MAESTSKHSGCSGGSQPEELSDELSVCELVVNLTKSAARDLLNMNASVPVEQGEHLSKTRHTGKGIVARKPVGYDIPKAHGIQSQAKLSMKISRSVATDEVERDVVFQSDAGVLKAMGNDILAAFESGLPIEAFPAGKLKKEMEGLLGKGSRKPYVLSHIPKATELEYRITCRKDIRAGRSDRLKVVSIDQSSLFMKSDYDASKKCYLGVQDAAITIDARDIYDLGGGFVLLGPSYPWNQLISDIPQDALETLYYDQLLCRVTGDGTRVRDVFYIGHRKDPRAEKHDAMEDSDDFLDRPLECVSGFTQPSSAEIVLAGKGGNIPVSTGMVVSFTFDECPLPLREAISGCGNPGLKAGHGFVMGIGENSEGTEVELTARLLLGKDNLPLFLGCNRLSNDAVFQTNLLATFPIKWVVSAYRALPITLHTLSGSISEKVIQPGSMARPYERNVFVAGHLEFIPGEIVAAGVDKTAKPPDPLWDRYKDDKLKSFALLSDYGALGGPVNDEAYKEHAIWKPRFLETRKVKAAPYLRPRAELHRVAAFPPEYALRTISQSLRLTTFPVLDPYVFDLRTEFHRFALSKARRVTKIVTGTACVMNLSFSGYILLQMVHEYAPGSTVHFKEGKVEAVVKSFAQAEKLLGSVDGVVNLQGRGIIQFYPDITFRLWLYNPTTCPEDPGHLGSEGRAQVEFQKYVAKDRHGGELGGSLSYDGEGSGGAPKGNYPCSSHPIDDPCYGCQSMPRRHWW